MGRRTTGNSLENFPAADLLWVNDRFTEKAEGQSLRRPLLKIQVLHSRTCLSHHQANSEEIRGFRFPTRQSQEEPRQKQAQFSGLGNTRNNTSCLGILVSNMILNTMLIFKTMDPMSWMLLSCVHPPILVPTPGGTKCIRYKGYIKGSNKYRIRVVIRSIALNSESFTCMGSETEHVLCRAKASHSLWNCVNPSLMRMAKTTYRVEVHIR